MPVIMHCSSQSGNDRICQSPCSLCRADEKRISPPSHKGAMLHTLVAHCVLTAHNPGRQACRSISKRASVFSPDARFFVAGQMGNSPTIPTTYFPYPADSHVCSLRQRVAVLMGFCRMMFMAFASAGSTGWVPACMPTMNTLLQSRRGRSRIMAAA